MRYAIVSDIHANLQAWNAVLTDIATQKIDRILCLGDIVGYGPNPSEVLSSLYRHVDGFCIGNHDAVICGKLDAGLFNDHAREMIEWTRNQLSEKAVRFLSNLPLNLAGPGFRCTHGDFTDPAAFHYITDTESAAPSWQAAKEQLLFFGHTHVPAFFLIGNSGTTHELDPQAFILEPEKRYLINPGSVGNPRSGDALATYCTFESESGTVHWRSVPFDLDAFRSAVHEAGLNEADTHFLTLDPRRRLNAIREDVDFSPAQEASEKAQGVTASMELETLHKKARSWKRATLASLAIAFLGIASTISFLLLSPSATSIALLLPAEPLIEAMPAAINGNWLPPFPQKIDQHNLKNWSFRIDTPDITSIKMQAKDGVAPTLAITVKGNTPASFRVESAPIRVGSTGPPRFTLRSQLDRNDNYSGYVRYAIEQLGAKESGVFPVLMRETKDPPPISSRIQFSTDEDKIIPNAKFVRLVIEGEFSGKVIIATPTLTPRE